MSTNSPSKSISKTHSNSSKNSTSLNYKKYSNKNIEKIEKPRVPVRTAITASKYFTENFSEIKNKKIASNDDQEADNHL